MMTRRPNLLEKPCSLDLAGPELQSALARIKERGGTALSLQAIGPARWRVLLSWRKVKPPEKRS